MTGVVVYGRAVLGSFIFKCVSNTICHLFLQKHLLYGEVKHYKAQLSTIQHHCKLYSSIRPQILTSGHYLGFLIVIH